MARRVFTKIVFALGLLCFITPRVMNGQQVTFAISPSTLSPTPAVGDTVSLQVSVSNFTSIVSFQYAIEWDPLLFSYIALDNTNIVDPSNFLSNAYGGNTVLVGWNSNGGVGRTIANGQNIFRLRLKVKAASTNYWAKFSSTNTSIEVVQYPATVVNPAFGNLGNPPGTTATPVTVQATATQTVPTQSKVCVDVKATDFTNIASAQWVTKWNPAVLRFDSISVMNSTVGFTATNFNSTQASGRIALNWAAPTGTTRTATNGAVLYRVCYTAIGANNTSSTIAFDSAQIYQAVAGSSVRVSMTGVSGTVNIGSGQQSTGLVFTGSNHIVNQNDQVCVQVKVGSFNRIAAITTAIFFDSTKMTLLKARLAGAGMGEDSLIVAGSSSANFNNNPSGTIRFVWIDPTTLGLTLPDSSTILELCFKYTGAPGTSSLIRFGAYGAKQVIKDGDLLTVPATYRNGSISVVTTGAVISATPTLKNVTCPAGADGGVSLAVTGGTGTYAYLWSNNATTKDISNVAAGKYKVTITSGTYTKIDSFTVTEPTAFSATNTVANVNCFGLSTGSITFNPAGGTAPYTYLWNNATTNQNLTGVPAGSYTVVITDSKGCKFTPAAITVTQPAAPLSIVSAAKTNVSCKSGSDGAINITVAGGTTNYTYSWLSNSGYTNNIQNITGLKADIYNLTITDSKGCSVSRKDTILEPDSLLIGDATVRNTNCGSTTGSITIAGITGGNGSNTFSWTGSNYTANTQNISNLAAGQYSLTVKDSKQCTATKTVTVSDSTSSIVLGTPTITHVKCNGGTDGKITAAAAGGSGALTYKWTGPAGFNFTSQTIDGLRAGTYNLTVSDASGCGKSASYEVSEPAAIAMTPSVTNVKCKGDATGAITLNTTGGTGALSFAWTGTTATTQNISNLKAGVYNITVSDANACTKTQTFTVTEPTDSLKVLSASIAKVTCAGTPTGAISVTVGGGTQPYRFAWSGSAGFSSTAQSITTLTAGTYQLTLTDANQCSSVTSYIVDSNPAIVITANVSDATRSPNGTITLSMSGGVPSFTYLWSGQGVNPTAKDQTGLCPGTYSVTATDAVGCQSLKSAVVGGECSTPMTFTVGIMPAGCPGQNLGKIDLSILGGAAPYTYTWRNAANDIIGRDRVLTGLTAGTYTIVVEDFIGQRKNEFYTVTGSQTAVKINSAVVAPETCTGGDGSITLGITDGAQPYSYSWGDLLGEPQPRNRTNIRAGNYSVQVKDANGCLKDTNMIIVPRTPCPLVSITTKKDAKCNGESNGSIIVNIQNGEPGYVIRWATPTGTDSVQINNQPNRNGTYEITGLRSGTYNISITDARGQTRIETQTVGQPTQIRIERTVTPVTSGCNGSIVLAPSGGTQPYTYNWNTGATSRDLFNLCCDSTKKYSVTVTDAAQCIASTGNDTVPCIIAALSANILISNPICKVDSMSGRIEVSVIGGSAPYTYTWANERGLPVGNNSASLTNVPPGRYSVTVTDGRLPNPQRWTGSAILSITSNLTLVNEKITAATDDITPDGKAEIEIQGGSADFNVVWCNNTTSVATNTTRTPSVPNLYSGSCSVTVTDRLGCREKKDFIVPSKSCGTLEVLTQIKCFGDENGSARIVKVSPDMTLPIQSYKWSTGETGPISFKLKAGENTVILTDATGKPCTARAIMNQPTKLVTSIDAKVRAKAADVEAIISGGVAPYSIKWIPTSDTARKIVVTKSGTYYVFVSDRNGCSASAEKDIYIDVECLTGSAILSPNDDSRNESFSINNCDYKSVRLEVYNRWGQLVYAKDNYSNGVWQGNDQDGTTGKQLPDGVYLYIMRTVDASGQPVLGKGTVTIVRQ